MSAAEPERPKPRRSGMADWTLLCFAHIGYLDATILGRQEDLERCGPTEFDKKKLLEEILLTKKWERQQFDEILQFFTLIELDRPAHEKLIKERMRTTPKDGPGPESSRASSTS